MSDQGTGGGFPPDPMDEEPKARVTARSVAIWGARATGGAIGVGVAVAVGIAAVFITIPSWAVTPPLVVVAPEPAAQLLVCPGPLLRLADDTGQNANAATPIGGRPSVDIASDSGDVARSAIGQSDAGTGGTPLAPQVAIVSPVDGETPVISGVQSVAMPPGSGEVVGLAATSCETPALRSWVIGGSTQLGRTSILTLVNPSSVEAVVNLSLYGELGAIDAVGLQGIVVPADSQRVVPISGFSLEERAPVIGVVSTGGTVAAFVQESIIRTLTPGGVDLTGQQDPSTTLVISGVSVAGEAALAAINATETDQDDTMPTLRLFAPGGTATTAKVALIPAGSTLADALSNPRVEEGEVPTDAHAEEGPTVPVAESFDVQVTAGGVVELPIEQVAPGEYTVVVTADQPLVGGLRASVSTKAGTDFAWYSPAGVLGERAVIAVPDTQTAVLAITNPSTEDRSVTLTGPDGDVVLGVSAGSTVLQPLDPGVQVELDGMAGLRAAIRASGDGTVAQVVIEPPAALAKPVNVNV
jgi:hypothetical protein